MTSEELVALKTRVDERLNPLTCNLPYGSILTIEEAFRLTSQRVQELMQLSILLGSVVTTLIDMELERRK